MILKQQHNSLFIRAIQIISWNSSLQVIADLCFAFKMLSSSYFFLLSLFSVLFYDIVSAVPGT